MTLNDDQQTHSFLDDEDTTNTLLPQLTANELNQKYGKGFKLLEALGYFASPWILSAMWDVECSFILLFSA